MSPLKKRISPAGSRGDVAEVREIRSVRREHTLVGLKMGELR